MSTAPQNRAGLPCELAAFSRRPGLCRDALSWHEDGLLIVEDGRVKAAGDYAALARRCRTASTSIDYRGKIITPGFIDTHLHYPQTDMIASPAPGLLPWLETYTFPTERQFRPGARARDRRVLPRRAAALRHHHGGGLLHRAPESVDAFFEAAKRATCAWWPARC
jgi:guanine deaminase